jgi:hypothetical protein
MENQQQKRSLKLAIGLGAAAIAWYLLAMLVVLHK